MTAQVVGINDVKNAREVEKIRADLAKPAPKPAKPSK